MRQFTSSSVALSCIVPVLLLLAQGSLAAAVASVWPPQPFHVMVHPHHHQPGLIHHNRLVHHYGGAATRGFHPPGFRLGPHSPHPLGFADFKFSAQSGRNAPSAAQYDPTGHGDPAFSFWNT